MKWMQVQPMEGSQAQLTAYIHERELGRGECVKRPAVLIFPGGGYNSISTREMEPVALAFFARGYQAFVLKYTVSCPQIKAPGMLPLKEAATSVAWIRNQSDMLDVQADHIAVCGFSAGGHLAASLAVHFDSDRLEFGNIRPDAAILAYPVISSKPQAQPQLHESYKNLLGEGLEDAGYHNIEDHVSGQTPPSFVWHTFDDELVVLENSLMYVRALNDHHVPTEYHVFGSGHHGLSMCGAEVGEDNPHCGSWFGLCIQWLDALFDWKY